MHFSSYNYANKMIHVKASLLWITHSATLAELYRCKEKVLLLCYTVALIVVLKYTMYD